MKTLPVCSITASETLQALAFPAISTGVYGFPSEQAAKIAVNTVKEWADECGVYRVLFCCFNRETAKIYNRLFS